MVAIPIALKALPKHLNDLIVLFLHGCGCWFDGCFVDYSLEKAASWVDCLKLSLSFGVSGKRRSSRKLELQFARFQGFCYIARAFGQTGENYQTI